MDTTKAPQNVLKIVKDFLILNQYDGLTHCDGECACEIGDLAPCGSMAETCEPGYRVSCSCGDHDYHITATEPGEGRSE